MAQQPNVESIEENKPRATPEPGPANKWRASKPGIPTGPGDVPRGSGFGSAGPDPGWAVKLVEMTRLPEEDENLKSVVIGLVQARAAAMGRAAVKDDIVAALLLCGYGDADSVEARKRRERWLAAAPHDKRPGATAVASLDPQLIVAKPEQIQMAARLSDKSMSAAAG